MKANRVPVRNSKPGESSAPKESLRRQFALTFATMPRLLGAPRWLNHGFDGALTDSRASTRPVRLSTRGIDANPNDHRAAFFITVPLAAHDISPALDPTTMIGYAGTVAADQHLRRQSGATLTSRAPAGPRARSQPRSSLAQVVARTSYRPDPAVRNRVYARSIAMMGRAGLASVAKYRQILMSGAMRNEVASYLARHGMSANNLVDTTAVYLAVAWLAAHGSNGEPTPAQLRGVRAQVAMAYAAAPEILGASNAANRSWRKPASSRRHCRVRSPNRRRRTRGSPARRARRWRNGFANPIRSTFPHKPDRERTALADQDGRPSRNGRVTAFSSQRRCTVNRQTLALAAVLAVAATAVAQDTVMALDPTIMIGYAARSRQASTPSAISDGGVLQDR